METFKEFPQMGRFTLRDEGICCCLELAKVFKDSQALFTRTDTEILKFRPEIRPVMATNRDERNKLIRTKIRPE